MMMSMRRLTSAWKVNFSAPSFGANALCSSLWLPRQVPHLRKGVHLAPTML